MKTKVWVIGGFGLVGEALRKTSKDHDEFDFSFLSREDLDITSDFKIPINDKDILIDLVPPAVPGSFLNSDRLSYHEKYTQPHNAFISKIINKGIRKYIFLSSGGSIYGLTSKLLPFKESDSLNPISLYGESKKIQELHLISECERSSIPYVILRPSNIFNSDINGKKSGLIGKWFQKFTNNEPIEIYGDLSITKDYISNTDVAIAILQSLKITKSEIINVGSGQPTTIGEILNTFQTTYNYIPDKIFKSHYEQDVPWSVLDTQKARSILNFKVSINVLKWIGTSTNR